jgi:hypothetical protein
MRTKKCHAADLCEGNSTREQEAQEEIDSFLRALRSYPDRFAREPELSFQQHLSSIGTANQSPSTNEKRRISG